MRAWADLYLTRDRKRVVERDDPARAFTYLRKGKEIPPADVKRYGIEGPKPKAPVVEPSKLEPVPLEKLEALAAEAPVPESAPESETGSISAAQPEPRVMHFGSADPGPAIPDEAPKRRKKADEG